MVAERGTRSKAGPLSPRLPTPPTALKHLPAELHRHIPVLPKACRIRTPMLSIPLPHPRHFPANPADCPSLERPTPPAISPTPRARSSRGRPTQMHMPRPQPFSRRHCPVPAPLHTANPPSCLCVNNSTPSLSLWPPNKVRGRLPSPTPLTLPLQIQPALHIKSGHPTCPRCPQPPSRWPLSLPGVPQSRSGHARRFPEPPPQSPRLHWQNPPGCWSPQLPPGLAS